MTVKREKNQLCSIMHYIVDGKIKHDALKPEYDFIELPINFLVENLKYISLLSPTTNIFFLIKKWY
jgi:hypothetical protein